jgi:outer membrane beta-barrel protein
MKRRFVTRVLAVAAAAMGIAAAETGAHAQEIQLTGPLAGAPAVRHMREYRKGRFEVAPAVSFTLLDQYRRTIIAGARLNYNFTDWLAVGVWGGYGVVSMDTDLSSEINQTAPRDALTAVNVNHGGAFPNYQTASFTAQTAKLDWVVAPQLTFTPFRGKLAIFNKIFVDTDFYIALGEGIMGIEQRKSCGDTGAGQPQCVDPASFQLGSQVKPTYGTYAVGFTFFGGDFWSLGVELRALPFSWNRAGFDSRGSGSNGNFPDGKVNSQDDTFDLSPLVTVSLGFYLPTAPTISP